MRGTQRLQHIPIEIVRTVVAISETGSLTKAGEQLGLSQPAVSSQIKRIEQLVGGALFKKTANGTVATELGKLALQQARKILDANDQLLRLGASSGMPEAIRLGISNFFAPLLLKAATADVLGNVVINTDSSTRVLKSFHDGFSDIICFIEASNVPPVNADLMVATFQVGLVWVRSRNFVLSPGKPIPLVGWAGYVVDDVVIRTLEGRGLAYRISFNSPDYLARIAAVEMGIGLIALLEGFVPPSLMVAREFYLPELPSISVHVCVRSGLEGEKVAGLIAALTTIFNDAP